MHPCVVAWGRSPGRIMKSSHCQPHSRHTKAYFTVIHTVAMFPAVGITIPVHWKVQFHASACTHPRWRKLFLTNPGNSGPTDREKTKFSNQRMNWSGRSQKEEASSSCVSDVADISRHIYGNQCGATLFWRRRDNADLARQHWPDSHHESPD